LAECCQADADDNFWAAAEPLVIEGVPTRSLCAADQLLHTCTHGVRWNYIPPIRWIADAVTIVRAHPNLDWDRLVWQAQQRHLVLPLREALGYLTREMAVTIPQVTLTRLRAIPVTAAARREYTANTRPANANGPLLRLWLHYQNYRRTSPTAPVWEVPVEFARYLQYRWGLDHLWQAPLYALVGGSRRVWRKTNWELGQLHETRHTAIGQGG
jgi:hypothetical protein